MVTGQDLVFLGLLGGGAYCLWFRSENARWPWEPAPIVLRRIRPIRTVTASMLRKKTATDSYAAKYKTPGAVAVGLGSYQVTATVNPRLNRY